ncbi:hypothetical protein [Alistipes finegoldii]|jgi:uncharacterized protein YlxW (UPF0749 family)|uniref:hypothetical protein n=1 Tax=Alistipes finegoldii TaxID=214856 RepID=UPI002430DAC7|nr:hypothetical protein [Alistipes finegoldii]
MELVSILLNFLLASGLAGTLVFFNSKRRRERAAADSAELENTEKVVAIQSEQITRLDGRVEKLEEKVDKLEIIIEHKDVEIDRSRIIIRQAYKCETPPERCPVLIRRQQFIEQEQAARAAAIEAEQN